MKRLTFLLTLFLCSTAAFGQGVDPSAAEEVARRGDAVEVIGGDVGQAPVYDSLRAPRIDNDKWTISVVTQDNCQACARLKSDLARSEFLRSLMKLDDPNASFSHCDAFRIEDQMQSTWRWKDIEFAGFPTILIQPPRSKRYGDPSQVIKQITGYRGNDYQLASDIAKSINGYANSYDAARLANSGSVQSAQSTGRPTLEPPVIILPEEDPRPLVIRQPEADALSLLISLAMQLAVSTLGSGGTTNALLIGYGAFYMIREYRKRKGLPLLIPEGTLAEVADKLKPYLGLK